MQHLGYWASPLNNGQIIHIILCPFSGRNKCPAAHWHLDSMGKLKPHPLSNTSSKIDTQNHDLSRDPKEHNKSKHTAHWHLDSMGKLKPHPLSKIDTQNHDLSRDPKEHDKPNHTKRLAFFCSRLLGLVPDGAPFSQLSRSVRDAMVVSTKLVKCHFVTNTCIKAD